MSDQTETQAETKFIYFVRHGESEANANGTHQDSTPQLSEKGRGQAKFVAERFAHTPIEVIIASPMVRAHETARTIAERTGKPLELNELIVENRLPKSLWGMPHGDLSGQKIMTELFTRFGEKGWRHSDEETFEDLYARAEEILAFLAARPEKQIAVVTHGNILKMIIATIMTEGKLDHKPYLYLKRAFIITNTGVTLCRFRPDDIHPDLGNFPNWRLLTWNDHAHLADV